jgi:hypothetical protein
VTSPLQAAFDQAAEAEAAPEPFIGKVAEPRRSAMTGVYMGEELKVRSTRPGAYDAMAIKSLFNGQTRDPLAPKQQEPCAPIPEAPLSPLAVAPLPPPKARKSGPAREFPTVRRDEKPPYRPQQGSTPGKVIEHLRAFGGFISHGEITEKFGLTRNTITAVFKPAVKRGALVRQLVDGRAGFSLLGWEPPAAPMAPPKPTTELNVVHASGHTDAIHPDSQDRRFWPIEMHGVTALTKDEAADVRTFLDGVDEILRLRPLGQDVRPDELDPEQMSALYELSLREAETALLRRYIAALQLRMQISDVAGHSFLPTLTEPPWLSAAA